MLMKAMMIEVDISAEAAWGDEAGWQEHCETAIAAAIAVTSHARLSETPAAISVSIRFADNDEVQNLNLDYRQKDKPTNILSFPMLDSDMLENVGNMIGGEILLGDMILAHGICAAEAQEKGINLTQHISHLIVHGTLHLLGFDHIEADEGDAMEALEVKALATLGLPNPYEAN
jgi:probable rRNA maturation factor